MREKHIEFIKKPLAIQLEFDIKTVRRALALVTGEAMTDEDIASKFFDREAVKIDTEAMLGEGEAFQICAAFVGIIMADAQPKKKPMKSKFQKRLDQIEAEKRALRKSQDRKSTSEKEKIKCHCTDDEMRYDCWATCDYGE